MSDISDYIWSYWNEGFSIIPIKHKDKKPNIPSWEQYQGTQPTREEIQKWLDDGLFQNIGVICGAVSNNLVVIDIDDEKIIDEIGLKLDKIQGNGSWVVKTGRGYHIYCRHTGDPGGIIKYDDLHIEFRANGGYIVAPPSIHPNGHEYHFFNHEKPEQLMDLNVTDVKAIFNDMVEQLKEKRGIKTGGKKNVGDLKKGVSGGERNTSAFRIACEYRDMGLSISDATTTLMTWNKNNEPPLHDREIIATIKSAYGYEVKPAKEEKAKKQFLLDKYEVFEKNDKGKPTGKIICPRLANLIMNEHGYHFLTVKDNQDVFHYNGGCYHLNSETIIQSLSEYYLGDVSNVHIKNEVYGHIRDYKYVDREIFESAVNLINLDNGVYNIETGKILAHDPNYHFLNKIPVIYNPDADCPKIKKFLQEVVYKEDIPVIQEFFGYCLYRRYHIHKACMFLGGGRNGKSTTIELLTALLGKDNISNKELQSLIYNRFALMALYGKLANASPDISNKALERTGIFKALTGGDRVDAEKKFKDSFGFINTAKLLFSANTLPASEDETYAFFSRWLLISFPHTFEGKKCNPNILQEITTPGEISGLFNWSIEGLQRLLKNGEFSYSKTVDEVMEQYKVLSDPIYAYCQEYLKCEIGSGILKSTLRGHYLKWCKENKLPVIPDNILTRRLKDNLPDMRSGRIGGTGKQKPGYMDINWQEGKNPTPTMDITGVEA